MLTMKYENLLLELNTTYYIADEAYKAKQKELLENELNEFVNSDYIEFLVKQLRIAASERKSHLELQFLFCETALQLKTLLATSTNINVRIAGSYLRLSGWGLY